MELTKILDEARDHYRGQVIPPEKLALMDRATEELIRSGIAERALKVGDLAPNFALPNATGHKVALTDLLVQGPVVIAFYRGVWCPYCNLELAALQRALPAIEKLGAKLVAISPQTPDHSLSTTEKSALAFNVLSDLGNKTAEQFGIVYQLPDYLQEIYTLFGHGLEIFNGEGSESLPIPATYVIAQDGRIAYAFVDPDYTKRADPEEILSELLTLAPKVPYAREQHV